MIATACGLLLIAPPVRAALPAAAKQEFQLQMRASSPEQRAAAVRKLAAYPEVETARMLFLLGLGDPSPEVRQATRQTLLEFKDNLPIGKWLVDGARTEIVKGDNGNALAALEALQVACEFEPEQVQKGLLLLFKDRRSSGTVLPQLIKSRPRPSTVLPAAAAVMTTIDRWATEKQTDKLDKLKRFAESEYFESHYGFRKCIVEAAMALGTREAAQLLIDTLPANSGRTKVTTVLYLTKATGQEFGSDATQWKSWWAANGKTVELKPVTDLEATDNNGTYYDIPIEAERVVFLVDSSDSMRAGVGGVTRLDAAKQALIATLNGLRENVEFNVITFHDGVTLWKRGLMAADARNKADAIRFVQRLPALGKTATYDGLMASFNCDPNLETIFCLSDGDPSAGRITDPAQILAEVKKLNGVRRLTIHSIGVFGGQQYDSLAQFMKALSDQNGGEFKRVE